MIKHSKQLHELPSGSSMKLMPPDVSSGSPKVPAEVVLVTGGVPLVVDAGMGGGWGLVVVVEPAPSPLPSLVAPDGTIEGPHPTKTNTAIQIVRHIPDKDYQNYRSGAV